MENFLTVSGRMARMGQRRRRYNRGRGRGKVLLPFRDLLFVEFRSIRKHDEECVVPMCHQSMQRVFCQDSNAVPLSP